MENNPIDSSNFSSTPGETGLSITSVAASYLQETGKWATFLSIIGFILCGLIVIIGLFAGTIFSQFGPYQDMPSRFGVMMTVMYVALGLIYFIPTLYLYRFAQKLKSAISFKDRQELVLAFENQKSLFKFWGIFTIIILGLYALIFVFAFIAGSLFS